MELHLNQPLVYFGDHNCELQEVKLSSEGIKFSLITAKSSPNNNRFNITIPNSDIKESSFTVQRGHSYIIADIDSEPSIRIMASLNLNHQSHRFYPCLRIAVKFETDENITRERIVDLLRYEKDDGKIVEPVYINDAQLELFERIKNAAESIQTPPHMESNDDIEQIEVQSVKKTYSANGKNFAPTVIEIDTDNESEEDVKPQPETRVILKYPPNENGAVTIYAHDLDCLNSEEFLNDTMLDFYLKYIHREQLKPIIADKTYIFSTFFHKKLTKINHKSELTIPFADRFYHRVKSWTRNVNIFEKDFLVVPINKHYHWYVAIICYPHKVTNEILAKSSKIDVEKPCIIYLDSLGLTPSERWSDPIRYFLKKEWEVRARLKSGTMDEKKSFTKTYMHEFAPIVPTQTNNFDCGLYVLQYVESFLMNPMENLEKLYRTKSLKNLFEPLTIERKRFIIKKKIRELSKDKSIQLIPLMPCGIST